MSDISKKPKWMTGKVSECGNFRIDCALGVELKKIRVENEMTLMTMSKALGWEPAKLSNYEHNIGALTDLSDALAIDTYCVESGHSLPDSAIVLSNKPVKTDLSKTRSMLARWREGDFREKAE